MEKLSDQDKLHIFEQYSKIYTKALPYAGEIKYDDFEIADFGLSSELESFKKIGLGLKVISDFSVNRDNMLIGHTGKILMNLPFQFMPEHQHVDIDVLPKSNSVPEGYVKISDLVNEFKGIYDYNFDGSIKIKDEKPVFRFKNEENLIVQSKFKDEKIISNEKILFHFEGKSETFKIIYGDMIVFADDAKILSSPIDPYLIPDRFQSIIHKLRDNEKITTKSMMYMTAGAEILLPKYAKHALVAGEKGAVFLEFSTPSLDEADVFTDKKVIR